MSLAELLLRRSSWNLGFQTKDLLKKLNLALKRQGLLIVYFIGRCLARNEELEI